MKTRSAGILAYWRDEAGLIEVFLVHPGGPFWKGKDEHAWSIPKGEIAADEDPLAGAQREFTEETGQSVSGEFVALPPCPTSGGKTILAWAVAADVDATRVVSNSFELEWPPHSGKTVEFPEVDAGAWFEFDAAKHKIHRGQLPLLDALAELLRGRG